MQVGATGSYSHIPVEDILIKDNQDIPVSIKDDWFKDVWEGKLKAKERITCTDDSRHDVLYVALREFDRDMHGYKGTKQAHWKKMIGLAIETGSFSPTKHSGLTRLFVAWLEQKHREFIPTLLSSKFFTLKTPIIDSATLLHCACGHADLDLFTQIMARSTDVEVNCQTPKGDTSLDYACEAYRHDSSLPGLPTIIKTLLARNGSYSQENQEIIRSFS